MSVLARAARLFRPIFRRTSGGTQIDYLVLGGLVVLAALGAVAMGGEKIRDLFVETDTQLAPVAGVGNPGNGNPGGGNGNPGGNPPNAAPTWSAGGALAMGTVGVPYATQVAASDPDNDALSYSITSGALPLGVGLDASGNISGVPASGGVASFEVSANDGRGGVTPQGFSIDINTPPAWQTPQGALAGGTQGNSYSVTVVATDADGDSITYSSSGGLPAGLSMSASGTISGTPTSHGSWNFSATATDARGASASRAFSIAVNGLPVWQTAAGPITPGQLGQGYGFSFSATDPESTVTYSVASGSLPPGLVMSSLRPNEIEGTPSAGGTYSFTMRATDTAGAFADRSFSIFINTPPSWTTASGQLGSIVAADVAIAPIQLAATDVDSAQTLTYAVASGTLPAGLTLSSSGQISGTPTTPGASNFTLSVSDGMVSVQRAFSIVVNTPPTWTLATNGFPAYSIGQASTFDLTTGVNDPNAPAQALTFSMANATTLPAGLSLASSGIVSGTPSTAGTYNFDITVSDGLASATKSFTATVASSCVGTKQVFSTVTGGTTYVVPNGCTTLLVKAWGAGGGGGGSTAGGGGAFISGNITVTAGSTLYVVVGEGGNRTRLGTTGFGGPGGRTGFNESNNAGTGGGLSGVFLGAPNAGNNSNALIVAGGGGGAGAGGSLAPTGGQAVNGTAGGSMQGGTGSSDTSWYASGGGGGGYTGGAGAACSGCNPGKSGAGGTSKIPAGATTASGIAGASVGTSDPDFVAGAGQGAPGNGIGGNGRVVIIPQP